MRLEINDSNWTIKSSENIGNIDEGSHEKKKDKMKFNLPPKFMIF